MNLVGHYIKDQGESIAGLITENLCNEVPVIT